MSSRYLPAFMMLILAASFHSARADKVPVTIKELAFSPVQVQAKVGDTIEWINRDFVAHTATARSGEWDVAVAAHKSASQALSKAGLVDYYCRFHPSMHGTITVTPR